MICWYWKLPADIENFLASSFVHLFKYIKYRGDPTFWVIWFIDDDVISDAADDNDSSEWEIIKVRSMYSRNWATKEEWSEVKIFDLFIAAHFSAVKNWALLW